MQINYVNGDLFKYLPMRADRQVILPHVCNNKGVWGAGFVLPLAKNFPEARMYYLKNKNSLILGGVQWVPIMNQSGDTILMYVVNMIGQTLGGGRPLYYNHLAGCMDRVAWMAQSMKAEIMAPAFGSGLAGGDWKFIEKLIEDSWTRQGVRVTIYYLPGTPHPCGS